MIRLIQIDPINAIGHSVRVVVAETVTATAGRH